MIKDERFFKTILDAIPSPVFVVDEDVQLVRLNPAAQSMIGEPSGEILGRRGGDVLYCIHSLESPEGCGRADFCRNCVVRNSVTTAFEGRQVIRSRMRMDLVRDEDKASIYMLVTASPFVYDEKRYVLLILEDISEIMDLKKMLPICSKCKKIRNDREYWSDVEEYFETHLDVDFTHSLCPGCARELYPELFES